MTKAEKKTLNRILHEIILLRDKKCLRCGNPKFQMSHIYPKGRYRNMEFDPDNVKALCYSCHMCFWHKDPIQAHEWLTTVIPKERLDRLKLMSQTHVGRVDYIIRRMQLDSIIKKLS